MSRFKKVLLISGITAAIIAIVVILFISPITKILIEKYDEEYTGRQITIGWVYVNPFTGYIHFSDLKVHELKSDSVFFSADGVTLNIAMSKLLTGTYEVSDFTLDHPRGFIIQNKNDFNFNDLIDKFSSGKKADTLSAPVHFNILSIKIIDGEFRYIEEVTPINYAIKEVNFESTGKRWDADTIAGNFSFRPDSGSGDVKGDFTLNLKSMQYRSAVVIHQFDLNIIEQYMKDLANYGSFSANLDADIAATGSFINEQDVTLKGLMSVNAFHFGKNKKDDYVAFDKFTVAVKELSPLNHVYLFDSVSLNHPYFKYERYDSLDNLQTMFGKGGTNISTANAEGAQFNLVIEIGNYIKDISKNFFRSDYKVNRLAIYRGDIRFNDYSISEKFALGLDPLFVLADSIDKNRKRVAISIKSGIQPFGNASLDISINPRDSSDFDIQYHLLKLPVPMFNPYLISYTSYPMDKGTIELNGTWNVINGTIQSNNHLVIIDPRSTKRIKNKDTKWIPTWLILAFIRERGNVIDYEIPITGHLKDPEFHLHDVISDVLTNIFVKPATTPYRAEVKEVEREIEKSLSLKWDMRHSSLRPEQEKFIEKMADFLAATPEATMAVYPQVYQLKEKEYLLFFEAKKKYFLSAINKEGQQFTEADSEKVDKMSVKDSLFVKYLDRHVKDTMLFTIQDKCSAFVQASLVNAGLEKLSTERENVFLAYFKNSTIENRIKIFPAENVVPKNGFSFFRIEYKGEFPESLIKAYRQMNQLNDESPRKKFREDRRKNARHG